MGFAFLGFFSTFASAAGFGGLLLLGRLLLGFLALALLLFLDLGRLKLRKLLLAARLFFS